MRASLTFGLILIALMASTSIPAQTKKDKDKPAIATTSRAILTNLQTEVDAAPFREPMKFSEFLALARDVLQSQKKDVTVLVDDEAYREERNDLDFSEHEIRLRNLPAKTSIHQLLRLALKQLPTKSAFVVRAGKVEIVPYARTSKEYLLNQTFHADFKEQRLDMALEDLSELTGVSIVVDGRAKQKVQTAVTARFHDDVALQDAVRMLTDMAELKIVYLVTGMYVTTPEHATVMQKELWKAYGVPEPGKAPEPVGPGGFPGMIAPTPIEYPPLFPPLPPQRASREPAA